MSTSAAHREAVVPVPRTPSIRSGAAGNRLVEPFIDHAELTLALEQRRCTHRPNLSVGCKSGVLPVAIAGPARRRSTHVPQLLDFHPQPPRADAAGGRP